MNPLLLSGYGVKIKVQNLASASELEVTDGRKDGEESKTTRFRPRHFPYSSVIVEGHSGYISLQAFHWLAKNNVPVFLTQFDGTIVSSLLPPAPIKADLRSAQFMAAANPKLKYEIAKALVTAKLNHGLRFLEWLGEQAEIAMETGHVATQATVLEKAQTLKEVRLIEGRAAMFYWKAYAKPLPKHLDFQGRRNSLMMNPTNASDPVNAALNYGYGFLAAECLKAINEVGLEPSVAFLHEFHPTEIRPSFAFDLQEPFRWMVDYVVMQMFQVKSLQLDDFYFTGDDYRYRFMPEAKQRFINQMRRQFNKHACSEGTLDWAEVIKGRTAAFGRFLTERSEKLDFTEPIPILQRGVEGN